MDFKKSQFFKTDCYINGEWVKSDNGATIPVHSPATGELVAEIPSLSNAQIKQAIDAAETALPEWRAKTGKERANLMRKWYQILMDNQEELAQILSGEMGKPITEARGEIAYGASFIEWFAEEAKRIYGETIPGHMADKRLMVIRQPIGVTAAITPWNFPNAMVTRKCAPALAAGCTMVLRPARETPFSAFAIAHAAHLAGIPKGVFSVVMGNSAEVGLEFCTNPIVKKLSFTGSTEVGRILFKQSADNIQKLSLELGGNAPFIVFDDADLDAAVEGAMLSKFRNAGQTCVCANRFYVQEGVYDAFADKLKIRTEQLHIGAADDAKSQQGPLINANAVLKVKDHIQDAVSKGAEIITGGESHQQGTNYFHPTILKHVTAEMKIATEETFGPLAPLFKFKDEADVIKQANNTIFGLASYFYAKDLSRVFRVAESLEYGMVGVNTGIISTEVAPFGGVKQSGLGREGSRHGIEDYMELKYICISI